MFAINKSKIIHEAYWLRALACIAVVLTHCVDTTLAGYSTTMEQWEEYSLILLRFIMFFGTPTFVFLSEMLLAHAYPNRVPNNFLRKRVNYLLLPFTFMAFIFAIIVADTVPEAFQEFSVNLAGGYTGYFILVIFQFYLLHMFLHKYLNQWSPKIVLPVTLIISMIYLGFFNFTEGPANAFGEYIWQRGYWLPFFGWLFYFALGYYCGRNFYEIKSKVHQYRLAIVSVTFVSLMTILMLVRLDFLDVVSSKRIEYLLFTAGVIFLIILLTSKLTKTPKSILFISKYSFTIYLVHKVFLYYLAPLPFLHPFLFFLLALVIAFAGSIILSKLLYPLKYSYYMIGRPLATPEK